MCGMHTLGVKILSFMCLLYSGAAPLAKTLNLPTQGTLWA